MECNRCLCLGYRYWLVAHGCRLTALPIVIDLLIFIMIHSVRAESPARESLCSLGNRPRDRCL